MISGLAVRIPRSVSERPPKAYRYWKMWQHFSFDSVQRRQKPSESQLSCPKASSAASTRNSFREAGSFRKVSSSISLTSSNKRRLNKHPTLDTDTLLVFFYGRNHVLFGAVQEFWVLALTSSEGQDERCEHPGRSNLPSTTAVVFNWCSYCQALTWSVKTYPSSADRRGIPYPLGIALWMPWLPPQFSLRAHVLVRFVENE